MHGAHDHALEHAAEHGQSDNFAGRIAVATAILSTAGAIFGYQGGATQSEALLLKNEAAIHKTEASNLWAYYQAKGEKQAIAELTAQLPGTDHDFAKKEVARYAAQKEEIQVKAQAQEKLAKEADEASNEAVHHHHRWMQAVMAIQIAIALAAITLLTRRKWMQVMSFGVGGVGCIMAVLAIFHL